MIQYSNTHFQDPRLSFEVMDITSPSTELKYRNTFNTVFLLLFTLDTESTVSEIFIIN